jgi:hypothetical protein
MTDLSSYLKVVKMHTWSLDWKCVIIVMAYQWYSAYAGSLVGTLSNVTKLNFAISQRTGSL